MSKHASGDNVWQARVFLSRVLERKPLAISATSFQLHSQVTSVDTTTPRLTRSVLSGSINTIFPTALSPMQAFPVTCTFGFLPD